MFLPCAVGSVCTTKETQDFSFKKGVCDEILTSLLPYVVPLNNTEHPELPFFCNNNNNCTMEQCKEVDHGGSICGWLEGGGGGPCLPLLMTAACIRWPWASDFVPQFFFNCTPPTHYFKWRKAIFPLFKTVRGGMIKSKSIVRAKS